nr:MAG TPA: hypothetical protein [Caudoviricetes sp.]
MIITYKAAQLFGESSEHPDSSSFSKDRLVSISYSHILYIAK